LLHFSITFHPATNGQTERNIQTLEDMLRAYALNFKKVWDQQVALIEFSYSNSYHTSIGMTPHEALYGRRCKTPLCWQEIDEALAIGPKLIQATTDKIRVIQERMRAAQSSQKSYTDRRCRPLEFQVGIRYFSKHPQQGESEDSVWQESLAKAYRVVPSYVVPSYTKSWEASILIRTTP